MQGAFCCILWSKQEQEQGTLLRYASSGASTRRSRRAVMRVCTAATWAAPLSMYACNSTAYLRNTTAVLEMATFPSP